MEIRPDIDPQSKSFSIIVTSNLVGNYFENLKGLLNENPVLRGKISITQQSDYNSAKITLNSSKMDVSPSEGKCEVFSDPIQIKALNDEIVNFRECALRTELNTNEFIPLEGYSEENLKNEIIDAVKLKRNFCIIKDYDEFLNMEKTRQYLFHQVVLKYGTKEYTDAALMIRLNNFNELRNLYKDNLVFTDWN